MCSDPKRKAKRQMLHTLPSQLLLRRLSACFNKLVNPTLLQRRARILVYLCFVERTATSKTYGESHWLIHVQHVFPPDCQR